MSVLESLFQDPSLKVYLAPLLFILMGFRHGIDSDHVAALSDLIIIEKNKRSQITQGVLYASGHSLVVLIMGFLAALLGFQLSEKYAGFMELAVGITLTVLGSLIILTIFQNREKYTYRGRIQLIIGFIEKLTGKHIHTRGDHIDSKFLGTFTIGIIHGIGAETPTQLALLTSSVGLSDVYLVLLQIILFTGGVLASTLLLVYLLSWGVHRFQERNRIYRILGWVTGLYSIGLGNLLIWQKIYPGQ